MIPSTAKILHTSCPFSRLSNRLRERRANNHPSTAVFALLLQAVNLQGLVEAVTYLQYLVHAAAGTPGPISRLVETGDLLSGQEILAEMEKGTQRRR